MRNEGLGMRNEGRGMRIEGLGMRNEERGMMNEGLGMRIEGYRGLMVWQKGMALCKEVYRVTRGLPEEERFGLTSQLRRAAVSVPSNIAEGHSRMATGDYRHHLQMARGSAAEVETQLLLCVELELLPAPAVETALGLCVEISKMSSSLITKLHVP